MSIWAQALWSLGMGSLMLSQRSEHREKKARVLEEAFVSGGKIECLCSLQCEVHSSQQKCWAVRDWGLHPSQSYITTC